LLPRVGEAVGGLDGPKVNPGIESKSYELE